jgi:hypothetical protein
MNGNIESLQLLRDRSYFCPYGLPLELLQPPSMRPQEIASGNYSVYMHILKYVFLERDGVVCRLAEYEGRCRLLKSIQI